MNKLVIWLFFVLGILHVEAQSSKEGVYRINWWVDGGITVAAMAGNYGGLSALNKRKGLDSSFVVALDPMKINAFDRPATRVDVEFALKAQDLSDIGLSTAFVAPVLLAIDPKIRKDALKVLMLYLEAGFGAGTLYAWGAALPFERIRPIAYNVNESIERRTNGFLRNSFYSGHVAQTAVSTFFIAKVLSDYHPEWGKKRLWLYGGAALLPAGVGYMRYRAGKHFTSDILVGFAVGAVAGILVPEMHRNKPDKKMSLLPVSGDFHGLAMRWKF